MITVTVRTMAGDIYLREFEDGLNTVGRFLDEIRPHLTECGPYDSVEIIHPKSYSEEQNEEEVKKRKVMHPDNLLKEGVEYLLFIRPFRTVVEKCVMYLNGEKKQGRQGRQGRKQGRQGRRGMYEEEDNKYEDEEYEEEYDEEEDEEARAKEDQRSVELSDVIDFALTYFPSVLTVPPPMTWQEADLMFHDELSSAWKSVDRMGHRIVRAFILEDVKVEEMVLEWLNECLEYKRMLKGYRLAEYGKISKFFER